MRAYKQVAATQDLSNLVDLTDDQDIGGIKTFKGDELRVEPFVSDALLSLLADGSNNALISLVHAARLHGEITTDDGAGLRMLYRSDPDNGVVGSEFSMRDGFTTFNVGDLRVDTQGADDKSVTTREFVVTRDVQNVKLTGDQDIGGEKVFIGNELSVHPFNANVNMTLEADENNDCVIRMRYALRNHGEITTDRDTALRMLYRSDPDNGVVGSEFTMEDGFTTFSVGDLRVDTQGADNTSVTTRAFVITLDDENVKLTGPQDISGDKTFKDNVYVEGQLNVVSANDVHIGDSIITLNSEIEATAAPSLDAGIEIARGTQANAQLLFDEGLDQWVAGIVGALKALATEDYVGDNFAPLLSPTFADTLRLERVSGHPQITINSATSDVAGTPKLVFQKNGARCG